MMTVDYASPAWEVSHVYLGSGTGSPITFGWTSATVGSIQWPVLQTLTFPAINGSAAQTMTFAYNPNGINRSPADTTLPTSDSCPCDTSEQDTATAYVPLVSSMTIKNGATQIGQFQMAYSTDLGTSGSLKLLTLPTGGTIGYDLGIAQHVAAGTGTWPDTTIESTDPSGFPPAPPPGITCPPTHHFVADALGIPWPSQGEPSRTRSRVSHRRPLSPVSIVHPGLPGSGSNRVRYADCRSRRTEGWDRHWSHQ